MPRSHNMDFNQDAEKPSTEFLLPGSICAVAVSYTVWIVKINEESNASDNAIDDYNFFRQITVNTSKSSRKRWCPFIKGVLYTHL